MSKHGEYNSSNGKKDEHYCRCGATLSTYKGLHNHIDFYQEFERRNEVEHDE